MRIWLTRRSWKRWAIGLAIVVAVALIANGLMAWRTEARLQARIAAIRAAGAPATIADLAPKPIPAAENAAAILEQLRPRLDAFANEHWRFLDETELGKSYDERVRRSEPPTAEQLAAISAIVEKYPDIESGITAAVAASQYASLANYSVDHNRLIDGILTRVSSIRAAYRFAAWQIELLVDVGDYEAAVERGIGMLRLARHYDGEPLLVNYLVGIALRSVAARSLYDALSAGPVSAQTHAALDAELAHHDNPQRLLDVLVTEQAYGISATIDSVKSSPWGEDLPFWARIVGWPAKALFINSLSVYDDELEFAALPWYERGGHGSEPPTGHGVLADLLLPALQASYDANARNLAVLRSLRIFNALTRYRDQHGREASGLEELSLPREAMIDPFSGELLKVKHTDDGWVIYSVMQNGIDDDGDFTDQKDFGLAPRTRNLGHNF